ncbi:hypothetical protein N1F78_07355 [Seonamhaeicola sp. MEBiC1930]|uniref:hypothetical protein n=1 Tax=Seonamhaeicola sp. MEBiC01930 TaxID=2976768 RepID=UPI003248F5B4
MSENNNLLKKIAGFAITGGLALVTQGSSNVALSLFNNITSGMAGNFIQGLDYKKIQNIFNENNPADLNHDIKKIIVKAVEWSVKNIEFIYKERVYLEKSQLKELQLFTKSLLKEVKTLEYKLMNEADSFYKEIENPKTKEHLVNKFEIPTNEFPVINANHNYGSFFKEEFNDMMQLCFGELLKKGENRNALIAYQRSVYQSLDSKMDFLLEQNKEILQNIDSEKKSFDQERISEVLKEAKLEIEAKNTDELLPEFETRIDDHFTALSKEFDDLKSVFYKILAEIDSSYFSKNKVYIISLLIGAFVLIGSLFAYILYLPFTSSITLETKKDLNTNVLYPSLGENKRPSLKLYVNGEILHEEVNSNHKVVFTNLEASLKGEKFKAKLIDEFWKLSNDSLTISKDAMLIYIEPNESLALIEGEIFNQKGGAPISDAEIRMDGDLLTKTDSNGVFRIKIPLEKRKLFYRIDIRKDGFVPNPYSTKYYPQSTFSPIGLIPKDD